MADSKISALSSGAPAQAGDEYVVARSGANYKLSLTDIAASMPNTVISVNTSTDALRITQVGSGNALLVEDSANPDATPTVITAAGNVGIGTSSPAAKLDVVGTAQISSSLTLSGGTANGVLYLNGSKVATSGSALTFDGANLGLGATPSAWTSNIKALEGASGGALAFYAQGGFPSTFITSNAYSDGTNWIAKVTDQACLYTQEGTTGKHIWSVTASNYTAGNPITFTQAMTLDSSGNLGIGTTSPSQKLSLVGTSTFNSFASGPQITMADTSGRTLAFVAPGSVTDAYIGTTTNHTLNLMTGGSSRVVIDTSGNLGLGVTPSAWDSNYRVFDIGTNGTVYNYTNGAMVVGNNLYVTSGVFKYKISSYAPTLYSQFTGQHAWYTAPSGTAGNTITFTQAMTLDASGNLGVGTTSGSGRVNIQKTISGETIHLSLNSPTEALNDTWGINWGTPNYNRAAIYGTVTNAGNGSGALLFYTNGGTTNTERARITAGGYFKASNDGTYVGSTAAYHELRTDGAAADWTARITNTTATAANNYGVTIEYRGSAPNGTGNAFLSCADSTATRAVIRSNGGLANYQANNVDLSDARTKNSITPAASMWDKVAALEIVTYKYNDQTHDDVNLGVIAQQVESVEPVWVDADGFGETPEGEEPLKTVYTKDITFAAIKALQEAMARIEQLEAKVSVLEAR